MIRINLLAGERQKTARSVRFDISQQLTAMCGLVVVAAVAGIGVWFWALTQESKNVDAQIVSAQAEAARLQSLLVQVKSFEDRKAKLQQRVNLIERLRQGQAVPVQLLDHVSRSLPDMLWLTQLKQDGPIVTIEGRSTTLISLSEFVGKLGEDGVLQKPIEIVNSQTDTNTDTSKGPQPDLIQFTVRAAMNGLPAEDPKTKGKR
jgi:type IV pilus assembly protein PilN